MARYIDADALASVINTKGDMALGTPKEVFYSVAKMIELFPAADVVEVVRCKDCKYAEVCQTQCGAKYIECQSHEVYMEAEDFCSYGERESE